MIWPIRQKYLDSIDPSSADQNIFIENGHTNNDSLRIHYSLIRQVTCSLQNTLSHSNKRIGALINCNPTLDRHKKRCQVPLGETYLFLIALNPTIKQMHIREQTRFSCIMFNLNYASVFKVLAALVLLHAVLVQFALADPGLRRGKYDDYDDIDKRSLAKLISGLYKA